MANSDISSDTVFQFAILRDPQRHPSEALERRYVRFDWSLAKSESSLMVTLKKLRATGEDSLASIQSAVNDFFAGNRAFASVDALYAAAHDFTEVNEWLLK